MAVELAQHSFISSDGENSISYLRWRDGEKTPKAVLQIVHGMAEYIARYDDFARFMASNGYAVYGNDHLGHGDSAATADDFGYFAHKDGYRLLVKDAHAMTDIAHKENPGLPVVLIGHSMGSFVARLYASEFGDEIGALALSGTSGANPASGAGLALVNVLSLLKGERHRSRLVDRTAFGSYNRKCEGAKTDFDWLSADSDNVARYIEDEHCGFLFTLSGYRDLFKLLRAVSAKSWAGTLPKTLPILLISGADDPVGDYGKGVRQVRERLCAQEISDVTFELCDGMRHEILNEKGRDKVWNYLLRWCDDKTNKNG
ncbi:MAG: alpha/beta hydrolase [Oscillospiraceae bacterium]